MRRLSSSTAARLWRSVVFSVALVACSITYAIDPASPRVQKEVTKMRAVLEENFQAVNEENLPKLIGTISRSTGTPHQIQEFAAEAKQMFEATDVYMRLVDFELTAFDPPFACATVTQLTLPADQKGSDEDLANRKMGPTFFRHHSGLLPEYELCKYGQQFHLERGKWKVHKVVSKPVQAEWPKNTE
jgi:hypothetical protein